MQCTNFNAQNMNIWSSNVFAAFEGQCYNSTYNNVQIVPNPTNTGRAAPLSSSNADGIHSVYVSHSSDSYV